MSAEHLASPIPIPDFSHLTVQELSALKSYVTSHMKEARKKAHSAIGKTPQSLKSLWMGTLSMRSDASEEDRRSVLEPFHREILKYPEAFFLYAHANALFVLDRAIMDEMLRRSKPKEK